MLGASIFITIFLWLKLGSSAEYRSHGSTIDLNAVHDEEADEDMADLKKANEADRGGHSMVRDVESRRTSLEA
jgi:hypothetical protein